MSTHDDDSIPLNPSDWEDGVPESVVEEISDGHIPDWIGQVEQRETVGDSTVSEYDNLQSPAIVKIPVVHCNDHTNPSVERRHLSGTLRGSQVKSLPWVLCDANPREPSHNKVVSDIQDTVLNEPEEMQCRNGGLTLVASFDQYDSDEEALYLGLQSREGLVNGGHTQLALSTLDGGVDDSALVEFEVIVLEDGLSEEERVRIATNIAETRNYEQELEERSRADHRGFYNPFKDRIDKSLVSWHENDSEVRSAKYAIPSDHLVRLFDIIDPNNYVSVYCEMASGHSTPTTSKAGPHGDWFDNVEEIIESDSESSIPRPFEHIYPILPAVLELRDGISASLYDADLTEDYAGGTVIKRTNFWQHYIKDDPDDDEPPTRPLFSARFAGQRGVDISTTLEALLIGYLRGDVWLPSEPGTLAGWFRDPLAVWEEKKVRKLSTINEAVDFGGHGGVTFSRNALLFHENQLFGPDPRDPVPEAPPEVIYDDVTRARYFLLADDAFGYDVPTLISEEPAEYTEDDATHYLDRDEGKLVEVAGEGHIPDNADLYRIDTNRFFENHE